MAGRRQGDESTAPGRKEGDGVKFNRDRPWREPRPNRWFRFLRDRVEEDLEERGEPPELG